MQGSLSQQIQPRNKPNNLEFCLAILGDISSDDEKENALRDSWVESFAKGVTGFKL